MLVNTYDVKDIHLFNLLERMRSNFVHSMKTLLVNLKLLNAIKEIIFYHRNVDSIIMNITYIWHFIIIVFIWFLWKAEYNKRYKYIHDREQLFQSLSFTINDVFLIYNLDKRVFEYISNNIERVLGINKNTINKQPRAIFKYIDDNSSERILNYFKENTLITIYETECEISNPKSGKTLTAGIRIYPMLKKYRVIRYACCITDLTKVNQTQQILKDALLYAQRANEAKKEFLSHMSHELRTPINAIMGMTHIAENSIENAEKTKNCLDKIYSSSKDLLEIINNILDMAKIDSDKLMIKNQVFSIIELVNSNVALMQTQAEINQQEFKLEFSNIKDKYLIGDELRLKQILINCISNSIKFSPAGGKIILKVIEVERLDNKALFRFIIADNGIGMSEEFIDRIFVPFEQEDSSIARKYSGSGLGMPITKNLVTLMGGDIQVESKPGRGTTITINIIFDLIDIKHKENYANQKKIYCFTGQCILVVEDNEINAEITSEYLKYVNFKVETANDGYKALELFQASPSGYYNAILMDLQMPGMDGYETAKAIRTSNHPDAKNILIVALSADTSREDNTLTLNHGINFHITKPIDEDALYFLLDRFLMR